MDQQAGSAVVVGVDGRPAGLLAVRWGAREARLTGRGLLLVHAHGGPVAAADRVLDTVVAWVRAREPDVDVTGMSSVGVPAEVLLATAEDAGLVVVGSCHGGRFARFGLGSVSAAVATRARCPVVVVQPGQQRVPSDAPIVVGTDGTDSAEPALGFAFDVAARHGAPLRVVRAWQPDPLPGTVDLAAQRAEHARALRAGIATLCARHPEVRVELSLTTEPASAALLSESARAHLVVVGTRGLGRAAGRVLGSVSLAMLAGAQCPVAVVPHREPNPGDR